MRELEVMMMKMNIILALSLVAFLLAAGCTSSGKTPSSADSGQSASVQTLTSAQLAEQQMNLAGVQGAQVIGEGDTVSVSYNPSDANYDGQIVSEWGAIFGVLSNDYPTATHYVIVQQFNGTKIGEISVNSSDVRDLDAGRITVQTFKDRLLFFGPNSTS